MGLSKKEKIKHELTTFSDDKLIPNLFLKNKVKSAGGGSRARDFWATKLEICSPDHESGAITRLGYPGSVFLCYFDEQR